MTEGSISAQQTPCWRPILSGETKQQAVDTVREIVAALPDSPTEDSEASLSGGTAGLAILCAYLSRAGWDDDENAGEFLLHAMDALAAQRMNPSLYGGFTGIAWTAAHLQKQLFADEDDPAELIDVALKDYVVKSPWQDDYDLIVGLVGFGVYALERMDRPLAVECLECIVDRLDEIAEKTDSGITWLTRPYLLPDWQREKYPKGYYNVGLAHGVPGVISLLGQTCSAGVARAKAEALLEGAVEWLLGNKRSRGLSTFPALIVRDKESEDCRLAWCYGDAGVAAALFTAARCVRNPVWENEALLIARRAATRDSESAGVKDAGLCHGAAGLGHIFNRFFQATGRDVFRQAAQFWLTRALEIRGPGSGVAGFSAYRLSANGEQEWKAETGILEGAAGVALALLASVTDVEPCWDKMLLTSLPMTK